MLRSINAMIGHSLDALDGNIGKCSDFLFDDRNWVIRYMVADTGKWLPGRKVLLTPLSLGKPDWDNHRFPMKLTKQQIENCPPLDEHAPVSREYEMLFHKYYGYANYWEIPLLGGHIPWMRLGPSHQEPVWRQDMTEDYQHVKKNSLRSVSAVMGYRIHAHDGEVGKVIDFIIEDVSWVVQWLVVDTRKFWPGPKTLVTPAHVDSIDWTKKFFQVSLSVDRIKASPGYDPALPISHEYEKKLAEHYAPTKHSE